MAELEGKLEASREQVLFMQGVLRDKNEELQGLRNDTRAISEDFEVLDRVTALETALQEKAEEVESLRLAGNVTPEDFKTLDDYQKKLTGLQQEVRDRELRLLEVSDLHDEKERDLECLTACLREREETDAACQAAMHQ